MTNIKLDLEKYKEGLMVIERGFKNKNSQQYPEIKSDISSILNMARVLQDINNTLNIYDTFLKNDVIKFRKIGESIYQTDKDIAKKLGENND